MHEAIAAVEASPGEEARWDALESLADREQRPDVVEGLYGKILEGSHDRGQADALGARALRFHDEWSGEPEALEKLLRVVLRLDVSVGWAFERMTMLLTMGERWNELLSLYDQALTVTTDLLRRREILDEAAHLAKDFAGQPDRAIDYLWQLLQLRPSDGALAASLERLLESKGRHRELVKLWELRAGVLDGDSSRALRLKAALCWLEQVGEPADAVRALEGLLSERYEEERVVATLERIAAQSSAPDDARARAYGLLESSFEQKGQEREVLRVLEGALSVVATPAEQARIHRRAAALYELHGEERRALEHLARLAPLAPQDEGVIGALRKLGARSESFGLVATALAGAADALAGRPEAAALREEAATLLADQLGDRAGAARLFLGVFEAPEATPEQVRRVGERLWRERMLVNEHVDALLPVLERLAELGPDESELAPELWRHELLGEAARVAHSRGLPERALRAWEQRLQSDASDREAIDGRIDALEQLRRWEPLLDALRQRAASATDEEARRLDLVRIAKVVAATVDDVDSAIAAWRDIEEKFGRESDTVDALAELYERAQRLTELEMLLVEAEAQAQAGARRAEVRARLGELQAGRGQDSAALDMFLASLADDPGCARAHRGLWALLPRPEVGALALAGLVDACDRTDDWRQRLLLVEHRIRALEDDEARANILVEAAADQETRAGEPLAAQLLLGRALEMNPGSIQIEQNLLRLAEQTGHWAEAASGLSHGLAASSALDTLNGPTGRSQELQARLGEVFETRLEDLPRALESYRRVAHDDPGFPGILSAVLRVSSRLGLSDMVAEALRQAATSGKLDPALIAVVEGNTQGAARWQAQVASLDKEIQATDAAAVRPALLRQLGLWYRDQLADLARAEQALAQATELDGADERAIEELADLQRLHPDRALVATLRRLSETRGGDEVSLREAAELALEQLEDEDLGLVLLESLLSTARRHWESGTTLRTPEPPRWYAAWAQERLVRIHERRGDASAAVQLLIEGAHLPFSQREVIAMLHGAATLARGSLQDPERAASLYREVLALDPADETSLGALAEIYRAAGNHAELVGLRRHELGLDLPLERRLEVRLDLAHCASLLGDEAMRIGALRDNLRERPGHPASISEVWTALSAAGKHRELLNLLIEQADTLERMGEFQGARAIWLRAAELAEGQLGNPSEAIACQLRAAKISETPAVLDALGRLHMARGEPAAAVPWLERRLAGCTPAEQPEVVQRLAAALSGAGRMDEARRHLEAIHTTAPHDRAIRSQLVALYRSAQAWDELVALALSAADHEEDTPTRLGLYLEAADVLLRRANDPSRAVELLRRASDLAPQDRALRTGLADALRSAGRLDEARQILEELLNEFGRRRPPERAAVHYQLAQLAQARGDLADALVQLDTASSMDMAHGGILLLLGRLARDAGQLDRSERAYRALLLTLRRQRPDAPSSHLIDIGMSEVAFELYRVAVQLGQLDRANEVLESAFASAAQSPAEAARLERALRAAGEMPLLLRAIAHRRERASTPAEQSAALVDLARAHEQLQQPEEAFEALSQATALDPDSDPLHETARRLARQAQLGPRYIGLLGDLAASADPLRAAALWLRLGAFYEQEASDAESARLAYERALSTGERGIEAQRALVRVSGALGDRAAQLAALRALVELLASEATPSTLADALYQLAAIELEQPDTEATGVSTLERALGVEPRLPTALGLLKQAAPRSSSRDLVLLYERTARSTDDPAWLLDALGHLARLPGAEDDVFREAVALADRLQQGARAVELLRAAVEATGGFWAMIELGQRARAAADWEGTHRWLTRASEAAEGDESFRLGLEAASVAAEQLRNDTLATQAYRRLWRARPGERSAWEPLLVLLRKGGDAEAIDEVLAAAASASPDPVDRRRLRMERAEALLDDAFRQEDAVGVLQDMLQDDPNDSDAQGLLLRVYEQTGRSDDLAALLNQQLEAACERRSLDEISALALRLGALLARQRRADAQNVYRRALQFLPDDPVLLREQLALLGTDGDPHERASLLERLLRDDALPDAPAVALQLADARTTLGDDDGVEAALRRGLALAPDESSIRARIEKFYTDRQRWRPLVELLVGEAEHQLDPLEAAARLQQAAQIQAKQLREPRPAVELLRRARTLSPEDLNLLRSLVDALLDAGDQDAARAEVTAALDRTYVEKSTRAHLLRLGALLALRQGKETDAVAALEQALSLGAKEAAAELLDALDQLRQSSARRGDADAERTATLRLADLCLKGGSTERGLDLLRQWTQRQPNDLEALRQLLALETAASNWPAVIELSNRLIVADPDETRTEAALRLLDACTHAGNPADARTGLEHAFSSFPKNVPVRNALKQLYEQLDAKRELADILLHEAADTEDEAARFAPYRRAAELYLAAGFAPNAIPVLEAALHAKPADHDCTVLLTDCYLAMNQLEQATNLLDAGIASHKNKRSPQLSVLQHRMARVALAAGDQGIEMQWLNAALDSDAQNGQVAAELADVATELGQYDIALKALRAITVAKNPGPMSKGMAFYRQGLISYHQGDQRKAVVMAKRGLQEDPSLAEARTFLEQLGEKV